MRMLAALVAITDVRTGSIVDRQANTKRSRAAGQSTILAPNHTPRKVEASPTAWRERESRRDDSQTSLGSMESFWFDVIDLV